MAATTLPTNRPRPQKPQAILEVVDAWDLPSGLRRVVLGGDGFAQYQDNEFSDRYVKFLFANEQLEPPYDLDAIRATQPELLPKRRTYTAARPTTRRSSSRSTSSSTVTKEWLDRGLARRCRGSAP